uniref:Polyprenol reductase n=2 Tax=Echinococcus granulosus TaxID=6210 RepID=A0A7E4SL34_ECHGR
SPFQTYVRSIFSLVPLAYGGIAVIHVGFKLASDLYICKLTLTLKEKWKWTIKSEFASLSWPKPTYAGCALHLCAFISALLYHWVLYFLHCAFALSYTKLFLTFTYIAGMLVYECGFSERFTHPSGIIKKSFFYPLSLIHEVRREMCECRSIWSPSHNCYCCCSRLCNGEGCCCGP